MTDTLAVPTAVLRPGAWLRFKANVPFRLRGAVAEIERYFYERRGVPVWLDDRRVRCAVDAAPVFVNQPDHIEERQLMRSVFESLRPGACFLDVGSHVGLYALGAAQRVGPDGRVLAFEPTPATVAKMRRNIRLNALEGRIEVHEVAVSDRPGEVEFVTTGTSMMNSIFTGAPNGMRRVGGPERRLTVPTAPLDSFLDSSRHHVAKIDTEGNELQVLYGATDLLASDARVFVELHPWAWNSIDGTWAALTKLCDDVGRAPTRLDGSRLRAPAHCRLELAR